MSQKKELIILKKIEQFSLARGTHGTEHTTHHTHPFLLLVYYTDYNDRISLYILLQIRCVKCGISNFPLFLNGIFNTPLHFRGVVAVCCPWSVQIQARSFRPLTSVPLRALQVPWTNENKANNLLCFVIVANGNQMRHITTHLNFL